MTGSWKGSGNQYIQFVRFLYCKLPTKSKQLPAFPLEAMPGTPARRECYHSATVAPYSPLHHPSGGGVCKGGFIYLLFYIALNSQGHIATGSLQVEETSAYHTVNHRASACKGGASSIKLLDVPQLKLMHGFLGYVYLKMTYS